MMGTIKEATGLFREIGARLFLDFAMFIAPPKMRLRILQGLNYSMKLYLQDLKREGISGKH